MKTSWLLCGFLLLMLTNTYGQRIADLKDGDRLITEISDALYNQEFHATQRKIRELSKVLPGHPIIDLLYALNIVWKTLPDANTDEFPQIEAYLEASIEKSELLLEINENDPEATFFLIMAHGLLAQYYAEQNSTMKAVSSAKKAYRSVIDGMEYKEEYVEFYFSSGLYDYYREKYPEMYPVYKSFVWIFKNGDKSKGIKELAYASEYAILSRVEAAQYLAFIYIRLEDDPEKALKIIRDLLSKYPSNVYFKMLWIEAMDMIDELSTCKNELEKYLRHHQKYTRMFANSYYGVYAEKVEKNLRKANSHYRKAIELSASFETAYHPISVAYAGMARVSAANNDESAAIDYYKKVKKIAAAPRIREEAEDYLKAN